MKELPNVWTEAVADGLEAEGWYVARQKAGGDNEPWSIVRVTRNGTGGEFFVWQAADERRWKAERWEIRERVRVRGERQP